VEKMGLSANHLLLYSLTYTLLFIDINIADIREPYELKIGKEHKQKQDIE